MHTYAHALSYMPRSNSTSILVYTSTKTGSVYPQSAHAYIRHTLFAQLLNLDKISFATF